MDNQAHLFVLVKGAGRIIADGGIEPFGEGGVGADDKWPESVNDIIAIVDDDRISEADCQIDLIRERQSFISGSDPLLSPGRNDVSHAPPLLP